MLNTIIATLIAAILFHFFAAVPVFGQNRIFDGETSKIKSGLLKRGTGEKSKVTVELRDGREIKGYIFELNPDDFAVTDSKAGARTLLAYSEVKKVKSRGLSLGMTLAIAGAAVGVGPGIAPLQIEALNALSARK